MRRRRAQRIDTLALHLPPMPADRARQLAAEIARALANRMAQAPAPSFSAPRLDVRVRAPAIHPELVAERVLAKLREASR